MESFHRRDCRRPVDSRAMVRCGMHLARASLACGSGSRQAVGTDSTVDIAICVRRTRSQSGRGRGGPRCVGARSPKESRRPSRCQRLRKKADVASAISARSRRTVRYAGNRRSAPSVMQARIVILTRSRCSPSMPHPRHPGPPGINPPSPCAFPTWTWAVHLDSAGRKFGGRHRACSCTRSMAPSLGDEVATRKLIQEDCEQHCRRPGFPQPIDTVPR